MCPFSAVQGQKTCSGAREEKFRCDLFGPDAEILSHARSKGHLRGIHLGLKDPGEKESLTISALPNPTQRWSSET